MATKKEPVPTTKAGLMAALATAAGITKQQAATVYDTLVELAYEGARQAYDEAKKDKENKDNKNKGWTLPGIGKLVIVRKAARSVRNPQTKEVIKKKACDVAKFRLSKLAKDALVAPAKK